MLQHTTSVEENAKPTAPHSDKLYMENNLLRVAGALFCHDQKRAAARTNEIHLNSEITERRIIIRPDAKLGQPGPLAHKIFVALIKKHSDCGRPVAKEISFTRREIGRLIGRKDWGGKDSERLSRALHEIHYTFITMQFKETGGRYTEHSFNIFPQLLIERREFASDPIEACTVTLAEPIVRSLQDEHFVCLNHALMQELSTIGQALYMRLFFHFANLYDGANTQRLSFQKRYDDICREWLGGLTMHTYRSIIEQNQLGPHLKQLLNAKFLASYDINKAKGKNGLIVSFKPGPAFYEDYDRFYRRRTHREAADESKLVEREANEPLKLAYLFGQKRTGHPVSSIAFVSSKDVETARQFLAEITFADAPAFLDFGLTAARATNFDVQTLGGLRQYLGRFKASQSAQAEAQRQAMTREKDGAERIAYDRYRRQEADTLFRSLSPREQQAIEEEAQRAAACFNGTLRQSMHEFHRARITAERNGDQIKGIADWREAA